ncbi:Syntaxin-6, putative [Perkinsus marinus ATCC 50983]|uniref:Syntaxin-6, putative n=1 Tax=Perkinsus marinus (strain ATCC 50983 / TXsc) TaxID=423536 RepID=C5LU11_PERM5|nr:Syntaxin-6, putative [Perkinsus marinus ATCC 50983]EEQ99809.1 Syntaxin-6, putative [Perkinsus marinus ATCC 50983]|eukprot:XP_002767092.1 Syntaxin-6, putative [Perkinsus marinus ATCC 50983]
MASSAASDPFYVARDEVQNSVDVMNDRYQEWQAKQASGVNLARSASFEDLQRKLRDDTHSLTADLRDVDASIRAVEKHPERFPHCTPSELANRRDWATRMRQQVRDVKNAMGSEAARERLSKDRAMLQMEEGAARQATAQENSRLLGTNKQVQEQIVEDQDEQLDDLARVTHRLGEAAQAINVELYDQQRMLSELDENIDRQQEQMNFVMGGLSRLLKTSDHKQLCTVIALFLILVFLLMWNLNL